MVVMSDNSNQNPTIVIQNTNLKTALQPIKMNIYYFYSLK